MARAKRNVVEYRIYELPMELPLLCLSDEIWRISDVLSERLHFHNCMEIGFCHSDSGFLGFDDETIAFEAGDIFLIPRHVPHTTCSAPGCKSLWSYIFVDLFTMVKDIMPSEGSYPRAGFNWMSKYLKMTAQSHPRLHFLFTCMLEEARRMPGEESERMLRIYSLAAAAELQRMQSDAADKPVSKNGKDFPLKPALEYIDDHFMEPCDTATLARLCHLSQTHFRRLFLSCMGTTPLQFVINARVYQACVLLSNTDEPVLSIAQAVGMTSVSSFNRNFQQIMGMSPRQYRSSALRHAATSQKKQVLPFKGWTMPEKQPGRGQ